MTLYLKPMLYKRLSIGHRCIPVALDIVNRMKMKDQVCMLELTQNCDLEFIIKVLMIGGACVTFV